MQVVHHLAIGVLSFAAQDAFSQQFARIIGTGDPVPGRPGQVVSAGGFFSTPFRFHAMQPNGDVLFSVDSAGGEESHDLIVWDRAASGFAIPLRGGEPAPGLEPRLFQGPLVARPLGNGRSIVHAQIDGGASPFGNAIYLLTEDGAVLAGVDDHVPGHEGVDFWRFDQAISGNASGEIAVRGTFNVGNDLQRGVYRAAPGRSLERVIDTTQPVPLHPGAAWESQTFWANEYIVDEAGRTFFTGTAREGGSFFDQLYRANTDGSLDVLIDGAGGMTVPNRPNRPIVGVPQVERAGSDLIVTTNTVGGSFPEDVLRLRADGRLETIFGPGLAIPGLPGAVSTPQNMGAATNLAGDVLVQSGTRLNNHQSYAVHLHRADGDATLVAYARDLPDLPQGVEVDVFTYLDMNERGDVILNADVFEDTDLLYFWNARAEELSLVLAKGMEIDGRTLVDYATGLQDGFSAAAEILTDDGRITLPLRLEDPMSGRLTWELYQITVPGPGGLGLGILGLGLAARRRRGVC